MNQIQVNATFPNIKASDLGEFEELAKEALKIVEAEPGTLQYDWFLSDDHTQCVVRETYENSDAVLSHLGNVGHLIGRLVELGGGFKLEAFGAPSPELLQAVADLQPSVYGYFQGK